MGCSSFTSVTRPPQQGRTGSRTTVAWVFDSRATALVAPTSVTTPSMTTSAKGSNSWTARIRASALRRSLVPLLSTELRAPTAPSTSIPIRPMRARNSKGPWSADGSGIWTFAGNAHRARRHGHRAVNGEWHVRVLRTGLGCGGDAQARRPHPQGQRLVYRQQRLQHDGRQPDQVGLTLRKDRPSASASRSRRNERQQRGHLPGCGDRRDRNRLHGSVFPRYDRHHVFGSWRALSRPRHSARRRPT